MISLHGKNIVHMTNASHNIDIHFYYGSDGKPVVMNFNGTMYGLLYNVQGDVVALFNEDSDVTVRYRYGTWGELLNCWGPEASTVGFWQPFRYRGYLWDWETGDYYCRSRQYRPEWGRFINADMLIKDNTYAYCNNSPVNLHDEDGLHARRRITRAVLRKLREAAKEFSEHYTVDIGTSSIASILEADPHEQYLWFASQVCDYAPWDLKRETSWNRMFPDYSRPTKDNPAVFRGLDVTAEDLGNMSYGYLGSSLGLSPQTLHFFAGVVQIYKGGYINGKPKDLDAFVNALSTALCLGKDGYYGDEPRDYLFIDYGIHLYEDDQAGILRMQGY